ncbi:NAD(P)H-dependent oxidoreductase [Candidatus Micrarchaeota archaeon]|nr:NAD(P)H-dependent oxidoreductase [Candidatus Micrarchaeota archaeon]
MKAIIICGSRRKNSLTRKLTNLAYEECKNICETNYLDLGKEEIENFRGFEEEYGKNTTKWIKTIEEADVIILASPIYDGLLSSGIKNLFEFIDYKSLEGKVAGFIVKSNAAGTHQQVRNQLVALMNYFNVFTNPRPVFSIDADFEDEKLNNPKIEERIKRLIQETIKIKEKLI